MFLITTIETEEAPKINICEDGEKALKVFADECLKIDQWVSSVTLTEVLDVERNETETLRHCCASDGDLWLTVGSKPMVIIANYDSTKEEIRNFVTQ